MLTVLRYSYHITDLTSKQLSYTSFLKTAWSLFKRNTILETFVASMFFWVSWKLDLDKILFLTSLLCFLINSCTFWSIPNRSECQNLKSIICVLIKPSDLLRASWLTVNELRASCPWRAFLFVEQFIPYDDSISGVFWW